MTLVRLEPAAPRYQVEHSTNESLHSPTVFMSTKTEMLKNLDISCFKILIRCIYPTNIVFIQLINVKMPTIVGILTLISRINFMLS